MADLRALLGDDKYDAMIEKAAVSVAFCRYPVERTPKRLVRLAAALHMTGELARIEREVEAALAAVLPGLLADVWDEGHADGLHNAHEYRERHKARNPYRPETTTRDATGAPVTLAAPDAINPPPSPSEAATGPHSPERTNR